MTTVVNAFAAFVQWAIEFVKKTVNSLISGITSTISGVLSNYTSHLVSSIEKASAEEASTGRISAATATEVALALNGDLFVILTSLSMVIVLATLALTVITNIYGFLIMTVTSVVVGLILSQMFSDQILPQAQTSVNEQEVEGAVNIDGTIVTSMCISIASNEVDNVDDNANWSISLNAIDLIVSEWALVISAWMVLEQDNPFSGKVSLAIGALAWVIGWCANIAHDKAIAFIGIVVSIVGLVLDGIEALMEKLQGILNKLPTLISGAVNIFASSLSIYASQS